MNTEFCLTQIYCKLVFIMDIPIMSSFILLEARGCYAGPVDDAQLLGFGADCFLKVVGFFKLLLPFGFFLFSWNRGHFTSCCHYKAYCCWIHGLI